MTTDDIQRDLDALNTSSSDANVPQSEDVQNDIFTASESIQAELPTPEQQAQAIIDRFKVWAAPDFMNPYAVLDSETTDIDGEIIELAIVKINGEVLFNERIRPVGKIQPSAQVVHGITDADVADCQTLDYWWPQIRRLICRHRILVYNRAFDFGCLDRSLTAVRPEYWKGELGATDPYSADYFVLELAQEKADCVMEAYAPLAGHWSAWHGSYSWAKLRDACGQQGVDTNDLKAHNALADAQATIRLIQAVAATSPAKYPWIGREGDA